MAILTYPPHRASTSKMEHGQKSFSKRFSDDFEQKKNLGTIFFFILDLVIFLGQKTKIFIIGDRALIFGPKRKKNAQNRLKNVFKFFLAMFHFWGEGGLWCLSGTTAFFLTKQTFFQDFFFKNPKYI